MKITYPKIWGVGILFFLGICLSLPAQTPAKPMTFGEAKAKAETFFDQKGIDNHPDLYRRYLSWKHFHSQRMRDDMPLDNRMAQRRKALRQQSLSSSKTQSNSGNWSSLGPSNFYWTDAGFGGSAGQGRINDLDFHPTNSSIVYACSPSGGLWKSSNGGSNWSALTDDLVQPSAAAMEIHPGNPNILYLLDGDAVGNYSLPDVYQSASDVYKSTNGGLTWFGTNVPITQPSAVQAPGFDLEVAPTNGNIVLAAIGWGVYRSTDGGGSWTKTFNYSITDIKFKPGQSSVVYGYGDAFYRSTDAGLTWTEISGPEGFNGDIAVSEGNPNLVYIAAGGLFHPDGGNLQGIWRSTNSGQSFTLQSTQAILGIDDNGGGETMSKYAISVAVNPNNDNEVFVGGYNIWRSANGGQSFSRVSSGKQEQARYCGYDIHQVLFEGSTLYATTGAGVWKNTGSTSSPNWLSRNNGLVVGQFYNLGTSRHNASLIYAGAQNTGANRWQSSSDFRHMLPGDFGDVFISRSGDHIAMAAHQDGRLFRTTNSGSTWTVTANMPGGYAGEFASVPTSSDIWCANGGVYQSSNQGLTWSRITPTTLYSYCLAVFPGNTDIIYTYDGFDLWKTSNGGGTWTKVSGDLPVTYYVVGDIEVDDTDPNKVWVTNGAIEFGPYYCHYTTNGGQNWIDISSGLPQVSINTVVHDPNSNDGIYVGTDAGVFYREGNGPWQDFNSGLPRTIIQELEIFNVNSGGAKLRAATFGRGLWESNLYQQDCPAQVVLNGAIIGDISYQASSLLKTTQEVLVSGSEVTYRSGGGISFFPGFSTRTGVVVETEIGPCQSNKQSLSGSYAGELPPAEPQTASLAPSRLEIWPNPTQDQIRLRMLPTQSGDFQVDLYDLQGKKLLPSRTFHAEEGQVWESELDLSQLPSGIYWIKVHGATLSQMQKVQVLR